MRAWKCGERKEKPPGNVAQLFKALLPAISRLISFTPLN